MIIGANPVFIMLGSKLYVATRMPKSWPVITGSVACLTLNLRANTNITPYMKKSKFLTMINSKNENIDTLRMNWQKETNCCDLQLTKTCFFYLPSSKNYVQVPKYESHKILYKFTVLQKINAFFSISIVSWVKSFQQWIIVNWPKSKLMFQFLLAWCNLILARLLTNLLW